MVLGLTGYYCSGKSTVEKIITSDYHFIAIDVDRVGHSVLESKAEEIRECFGPTVINSEGKVDRKALGRIVFADGERLKELNSIVHPAMREVIKERIAEHPGANICINAAILFEMGLDSLCDAVLIVRIGLLETIGRGKKRDGHGIRRILRIVSSQKLKELAKKNPHNVDIYTIKNSKLEQTKAALKKVMAKLKIY